MEDVLYFFQPLVTNNFTRLQMKQQQFYTQNSRILHLMTQILKHFYYGKPHYNNLPNTSKKRSRTGSSKCSPKIIKVEINKKKEDGTTKGKRKKKAQLKKPEPPSLYQRIAAFIRSMVQDEKPQLPKDMYSLENVQKERKQRNKPLKKSYFIRSKKPIDPRNS